MFQFYGPNNDQFVHAHVTLKLNRNSRYHCPIVRATFLLAQCFSNRKSIRDVNKVNQQTQPETTKRKTTKIRATNNHKRPQYFNEKHENQSKTKFCYVIHFCFDFFKHSLSLGFSLFCALFVGSGKKSCRDVVFL